MQTMQVSARPATLSPALPSHACENNGINHFPPGRGLRLPVWPARSFPLPGLPCRSSCWTLPPLLPLLGPGDPLSSRYRSKGILAHLTGESPSLRYRLQLRESPAAKCTLHRRCEPLRELSPSHRPTRRPREASHTAPVFESSTRDTTGAEPSP